MNKNEIEKAYTIAEVAEILEVHYQTALELINSGELRGYKIAKRWRVPVSELKRYTSIDK